MKGKKGFQPGKVAALTPEIKKLWQAGASCSAVARALKIDPSTVSRLVRSRGWTRSRWMKTGIARPKKKRGPKGKIVGREGRTPIRRVAPGVSGRDE